MKRKNMLLGIFGYLAIIAVCFPITAHAYFDPGTGSMLLQMLGIAFIAMSGFFVAFKNRIIMFFDKKNNTTAGKERQDGPDELPDDQTNDNSPDNHERG